MISPAIDISPQRATPAPRARGRLITLAVLCLAKFVGVMGNTTISIGIPAPGQAFDMSTAQLQRIVNVYTLVFVMLVLSGGHLGGRVDRWKILTTDLPGFAVASFASAMTTHITVLIGLRVSLGVCAALAFPAALSLTSTIFKGAKHRALAVRLWAVTAGLRITLGLAAGGLLLEHFEWSPLFWINIMIVLPVAGISPFLVPESRSSKLGRFDAVGMCLTIAALDLFAGSIIGGPQLGWTTLPVPGGLATSILLAEASMAWEGRVSPPMPDLSLSRVSNVTTCSLAIGLVLFSLFGFTFTITIYFQTVRGYSALQAGLTALPFAVVMGACSSLALVLARRFGTGRCVPFGIVLMGIGFWIMSLADVTDSH